MSYLASTGFGANSNWSLSWQSILVPIWPWLLIVPNPVVLCSVSSLKIVLDLETFSKKRHEIRLKVKTSFFSPRAKKAVISWQKCGRPWIPSDRTRSTGVNRFSHLERSLQKVLVLEKLSKKRHEISFKFKIRELNACCEVSLVVPR